MGRPDAVETVHSPSTTEDRFRLIVDSAPALIHTALPDGNIDFFNRSWLEYVGRPSEDLQGWKWTAAIHPEDVVAIVEKWRTALRAGEPFEHEARVRRADGEYRWMIHRKVALRDERGNIVKWYGSSIDIEDRKRAEDRLQAAMSERARLSAVRAEIAMALARKDTLRGMLHRCAEAMVRHLDAAFARIWTLRNEGAELELEASAGIYTRLDGRYSRIPFGQLKIGLIAQERKPHLTNNVRNDPRIHNKDWAKSEGMIAFAGYPLVVEDRVVGVMGMFSRQALTQGTLETLAFIADGIAQGIARKRGEDEQVQAQEALRRSQLYLAEGERLAHTGGWAFDPAGFFNYWSPELFRIYGLDPAREALSLQAYLDCIQPQDREFMAEMIREMLAKGRGCDVKKRIVRPDGAVRCIRFVGTPLVENGVLKSIVGTAMDVTEHEEMTQELLRRQAYLAEAQRLSHTGSFGWRPSTGEIFWSEETFRIFEYDPPTKPTVELVLQRVHPEDKAKVQEQIERATRDGKDFDREYRLLMPGGSVKHVHVAAHAVEDETGTVEFVGAVMDVTTAKQVEEKIREREAELRQILDLTPQIVGVYEPGGVKAFANRFGLEYMGISLEEWRQARGSDRHWLHPDERERFGATLASLSTGSVPAAYEHRLRRHDGSYRWFLARWNALRDEEGQITRWYVTSTDIDDRKRAEERLQEENVALREEIDKASMFEEIVGASPALRVVLSAVAKVAPTESTVLITGETGTGKELIARAIHKQSPRSSRPFVSMNCAAIPRDLIASELFGHEKGAFTGALQRRLGRFELAERGTLFLDEVGDLPSETQIALLRVLQEREFQRVGGNQSIRADARVIAATNRNLQAAIGAGTFRGDLFYRLNVFPIHIPPLRERKDDISILVEYFIGRFAAKAGKKIRNVEKKTLDLLQSYPWPGNIRELQNVIERSVIVCETETLSVDESWLSRESVLTQPPGKTLSKRAMTEEKQIIEAALAEARGRVSGPLGAAAKLGLPASTLESKIRSLKIDKYRFRTV